MSYSIAFQLPDDNELHVEQPGEYSSIADARLDGPFMLRHCDAGVSVYIVDSELNKLELLGVG